MPPPDASDQTQTRTAPPRSDGPVEKGPYLLVVSGPQFGQLCELAPGREVVLGRRDDADLQLFDDGVSRRHAALTLLEAGARVVDLDSANGTFVDGQRISEAVLRDGARLQLGAHTTIKFVWSDDVESGFQRKLAQAALHEPLTGLYNRRHFMERLTAELAAAQRHGRALALLLLDPDHFRRVNDRYGHLAGDEALRAVAFALQGSVRKEDVAARFGGEEFVVLARETTLTGAKTLAERIRRTVERAPIRFEDQLLSMTVSIGVTVSVGLTRFEPGRTEQQLIHAAERALSRAKQNGRNTVVAAPAIGG